MLKRRRGAIYLFLGVLLCLLVLLPLGRAEARPAGTMAGAVPSSALAPFLKAKINWKQAAGQTISVALTDEFDTDAVHLRHSAFLAKAWYLPWV